MQLGNRYIIFSLAAIGSISCIYFLCLLVALPVVVPAILGAGALYFLYTRIVPDNSPDRFTTRQTSWLSLFVFTMGLAVLTKNALNLAEKHGGWDAWAIWNFHARYLMSSQHWQRMFQNTVNDHPDYPLMVPSFNAFVIRLLAGKLQLLVPFVLSIFTTLAAPALIFSEFAKKHLVVASLALFLFACNTFYISIGISQYSDSLLGLFFLAAMVCMDHVLEHSKYIALSAAFLGCCIWTKNEGAILAAIFMLFYAHRFFARRYIRFTLMGISLPVLCFIIFKLYVPVANDLVSGLNNNTWALINSGVRYQIIYTEFNHKLQDIFPYMKKSFYAYLILCALRRRWPDRQMVVVCACLLVYMLIYVVTRYDIQWHLATSQNRLMVQLMPAMVYAMCLNFSALRLSRTDQFSFKMAK